MGNDSEAVRCAVLFPDCSAVVYEFPTEAEYRVFMERELSPTGRYGREFCRVFTLADLTENGGALGPEDARYTVIKDALDPGDSP